MSDHDRPCPVCGALDRRLLFRQDFAALSAGSLLTGYDVVVCADCGMAFADHIPEQPVFDAYYRDMSKYEGMAGPASSYELARFRRFADFIQQHLPGQYARILEFGCATGGLLAEMKGRGYGNVMGVDPSPACAARAAEMHDVKVFANTLLDIRVDDCSVDALILNAVLEHVRDLGSALARLRPMLSRDGRLLVAVPDASRYDRGEDAPFQEFSTEHINFFGSASMNNLMLRNGLTVQATAQEMVEANFRTTTPVLYGVYRPVRPEDDGRPGPDRETGAALERYIVKSRQEDDQVHGRIAALAERHVPIIVWGTGAHTLRLLATSRLGEIRVNAFVDNNPRYQGKELQGVPVIAPKALSGRAEPVLISSRVYQREIEAQARKILRNEHEVVLLY